MRFYIGLTALIVGLFLQHPPRAFAFHDKAISVGLGFHSQNVLGKVAKKDTGETALLGETFYPLNLKCDMSFGLDWFFAPQLSYTFLARKDPGDTAKVTFGHLVFQFGQNLTDVTSLFVWDLYGGPGLIRYQIAGAGGTTVMNNGTSTATFAVPGNSVTVQKVTVNVGSSLTFASSRLAFDVILENAVSTKKRTQSFMLGYSYQFGDQF